MRKLEEFKRQKWEIEKRFKGRAENEEEELIFFEVKKKYKVYKEALSGLRVEEKEWSKYVKNVECKTKE